MPDAPSVTDTAPQHRERATSGSSGVPMLLASLAITLLGAAIAFTPALGLHEFFIGVGIAIALVGAFLFMGLTMVAPNEARVVQLFGRYVGTMRTEGLHWVNPLTERTKISTRIRNHETSVMKVNDASGSPIEISAVAVWQVEDTARASFEVDDFVEFVSIQTEAAVRHIAGKYPYDSHDADHGYSLRDNAEAIGEVVSIEVVERVVSAGVRVIENRVYHLAYDP